MTNEAAARRALLSSSQVGLLDAAAARAGVRGGALMARAGRAVAEVALDRYAGRVGRALILAGPGKNGGDGYVAASALAEVGRAVEIWALGDPVRDGADADASAAAAAWRDGAFRGATAAPAWTPIEAAAERGFEGVAFVVDALFGVGLARDLSGAAARLAERLSAPGAPPVLAVDMPSGVCADSGEVLGAAMTADATVTFVRPRRGHALGAGALRSGAVLVRDIGAPEAALIEAVAGDLAVDLAPELWSRRLGARRVAAHKFDYGHASTVSGGLGATGAARLTARASLRAGAGLATVVAPTEAIPECAAQLTAVMLREASDAASLDAALSDPRVSAVALGPGLAGGIGRVEGAAKTMAQAALSAAGYQDGRLSIALDADALTCWEGAPEALFRAISREGETTAVMTPHMGEFRRVFPDIAARLSNQPRFGKIDAVRAAADRSGAVVLLKGFDTAIAAPDGRVGVLSAVGDRAAPQLATAGSGDVLLGFVLGLLAQGWPAYDAAAAGAWLHLEAGRSAGPGMIAEDLVDAARQVIARQAMAG